MDLDPDKVTNNMDEAALQAEIMKGFQAPQAEQEAPVAGVDAMDTSGAGGGNIGVGQAPVPNEQGFTGNVGQQANTQQTQATGQQQPPVGSIQ